MANIIINTSGIEAQFKDVPTVADRSAAIVGLSTSSALNRATAADQQEETIVEDEDNQDWEWVEESEYIILDFGGSNIDAKDMERMTRAGYILVGLDTPTPYFQAGAHTYKGFFDENAITEDLLFEMKAHEEPEEGMNDSDDEGITESLDLIDIVTKRIVFEPVELLPLDTSEFSEAPWLAESEPERESEDSTKRKNEPKKSIWKAAYDAIGIERKHINVNRAPRPGQRPRRGRPPLKTPTPPPPELSEGALSAAHLMDLDSPRGTGEEEDNGHDGSSQDTPRHDEASAT
ncbi:hypothetical protein EDD11_007755 [Mortierella claussenii]|nr:hypothetical protein EDD11_007755 [Mortierella claussenii]